MALASTPKGLCISARPRSVLAPRLAARPLSCRAQKQDLVSTISLPLATLVAAGLLSGAVVPEEAMAARSGGRVGGSGFSARKRSSGPSVTNYNTYVAPPVVAPPVYGGFSPFGFSPFGFGGVSIIAPLPFSGLFQMFFLIMVVSVVFNVIRGFAQVSQGSKKKNDSDWDEL